MKKTRRRNKKRIKAGRRCACGSNKGQHRRQCTAYCDDSRNFKVLCRECQEQEDEYWAGMWKDYYRGCL